MRFSRLLTIVLGGVAIGAVGACGGSSSSPGLGGAGGSSDSSSDGTGAGSPSGSTGTVSPTSVSSSASGSSTGGPSSSSGSSTSSTSSSSSGTPAGPAGYAIPLAAPGGPDFEYTAQTTVGDQTFTLSIDTGSTTLGIAGTSCVGCTGVTPLYTPSSSAMATGKNGQSYYADGSGWAGAIYSDTVGLANGTPTVKVALVEITKAKGFFSGQNDYQGILGLGPIGNAVAGTTGYMPAVVVAGVPHIFAFQLCDTTGDNAGTMWLGGNGTATSLTYTPMVPISANNPFYGINVDAMSLGGTSVVTNAAATFAQPVLDTGTSLFYVPTSVFTAFQKALEASAGFKAVFGAKTFGAQGCVTAAGVTDAEVESKLPPLVLSLPNMTSGQPDVTIQAGAMDTYLYNGGTGSYCLAMQDGGTQDPSTFGDAFLQAFLTVIDVENGRVGFAQTGCAAPQVWRPHHPEKNGPHRAPRPAQP